MTWFRKCIKCRKLGKSQAFLTNSTRSMGKFEAPLGLRPRSACSNDYFEITWSKSDAISVKRRSTLSLALADVSRKYMPCRCENSSPTSVGISRSSRSILLPAKIRKEFKDFCKRSTEKILNGPKTVLKKSHCLNSRGKIWLNYHYLIVLGSLTSFRNWCDWRFL